MANSLPPPPDPATKVDEQQGVNAFWHEWFTRLYRFVIDLAKRITALEVTPTVTTSSGMVPYYIAPTETFTVPLFKQALFAYPIDNQGILVVDGFLIQVD